MKQFDNDYDMLFQVVKKRQLRPGLGFADHLSSFGLSQNMLDRLEMELPLLTIMVPMLKNFSAETWDIATEIPLVAVINDGFSEKVRTPVPAFDNLGNMQQLKSNVPPSMPVIVVKENERVLVQPKVNTGPRADNSNYIYGNKNQDFYFASDSYNRKKTGGFAQASSRFDIPRITMLDNRTYSAWSLGATVQRDYVYYNILNPGDVGPLDRTYEEHLSGIAFDPISESYLNDDWETDWADGIFEFQLDVIVMRNSVPDKISKLLAVPINSQYFTNSTTTRYIWPGGIPIDTWNMQEYGDTWKYVMHEIDGSSSMTVNFSASTKIGSNYTFNSTTGKDDKISTGFGNSVEQTVSSNITIEVKQGSDFCGEAVVNYLNPVIIGSHMSFGMQLHFAEINTGIVRLLVYPRFKQ